MKTFSCACGQRIFFENTHCVICARALGFDPTRLMVVPLEPDETGTWRDVQSTTKNDRYSFCKNQLDYNVCNWLIATDDPHDYCIACRLNQMVPSLSAPENRDWWSGMEASKRRLIYTLLQLGLPVVPKQEDPERGLAFAFLQDRRTNPLVDEEHVLTGHSAGLITVNLAEADHAARESTRQEMNEPYRTLLGHFRHESGHYYWERLIKGTHRQSKFRALFGDETTDYQGALQHYHAAGPPRDWRGRYISAYAQAHPLEDWSETWAHYLHMVDTLETAADFGLISSSEDFDQWIEDWVELTVTMNALNRSMGLHDAYPFVLSTVITDKLRFVHQLIESWQSPTRSEAGPETLP